MFRIGAEIFGNHKIRIQNFKARRQALLLLSSMGYRKSIRLHYENVKDKLEPCVKEKLEPLARLYLLGPVSQRVSDLG